MALFLIELRILFIVMLAELYNSISKRNFIRLYTIEYFLDFQCNQIAKYLRKSLKLKIHHTIYEELVVITRIQKGGGLGDIYKKIVSDKKILTLSTSIFDFRSLEQKGFLKEIGYEKISIFGMIPRIKKMVGYISNDSLKKIYILNEPCDPLIYISYLIYSRNFKNFVFYHHADHTFCFGALEKRWTHIDLFQNQYQICKKKLKPIFNSMINFL
tara:strand:+ start:1583 stop:2224 length:642 start_codon:yes stop_codon:yes gene_type:complete